MEKNDSLENSQLIEAKSIKDIQKDFIDKINTFDDEKNIVITDPAIDKAFVRLFKSFDKVEAAGGIVRRKNRFLFIKRNGFWDIPKGKLEEGEDIETCAIREIEEECGIKNPVIEEKICITYHTYFYNTIPTIKKTYWFALSYKGPKTAIPQLEEGITKVKWKKANKLDKIRNHTFASINEVIDQYFAIEFPKED